MQDNSIRNCKKKFPQNNDQLSLYLYFTLDIPWAKHDFNLKHTYDDLDIPRGEPGVWPTICCLQLWSGSTAEPPNWHPAAVALHSWCHLPIPAFLKRESELKNNNKKRKFPWHTKNKTWLLSCLTLGYFIYLCIFSKPHPVGSTLFFLFYFTS